MQEWSIPALPDLPTAEKWRNSVQISLLRGSPELQALSDALETYETSFKRYNVFSRVYAHEVDTCGERATPVTGLPVETLRGLAQKAYERAVNDFEAVDLAFGRLLNSDDRCARRAAVAKIHSLFSDGDSQPGPRAPPQAAIGWKGVL